MECRKMETRDYAVTRKLQNKKQQRYTDTGGK